MALSQGRISPARWPLAGGRRSITQGHEFVNLVAHGTPNQPTDELLRSLGLNSLQEALHINDEPGVVRFPHQLMVVPDFCPELYPATVY